MTVQKSKNPQIDAAEKDAFFSFRILAKSVYQPGIRP